MKFCYHCMTQIKEENISICPNCGKSLKTGKDNGRYLPAGTVLQDKFIVGYPLGAGGFGITYIGWDMLLLRKVAIKEFYPEQYTARHEDGVTVSVTNDDNQTRFEQGLKNFLEEARSVAALQDIKGVVSISNFFEANGTGYIVMEYLEGMDVKHILKIQEKNGQKKDYEWCRKVILTVLYTLREVHARGVIHRDIAPDNIFVTKEGIIKLIDFGAAKHANPLANMSNEIVLKEGYAPIEQYSRYTEQGTYTDIYATAALFYRMLVGKKPIAANERVEHDTLKPPSELGVDLPESAELAIMVCLNVLPEYRLATADEFMEALGGQDFVPDYEPEWILPEIEETVEKQKMPVATKVFIGVAAAAICVGIGGYFYSSHNQNVLEDNAGTFVMKDFQNTDIDSVTKELQENGYENIKVTYVLNGDTEKDLILTQSVKAGEQPETDEEISFEVSGGMEEFSMPDCSDPEVAEAAFADMDFDVKVKDNPYKTKYKEFSDGGDKEQNGDLGVIKICYEFNDEIKNGELVEIDLLQGEEVDTVQAGELVTTDRNIQIVYSCGAKEDYVKEIPDFTGMTEKEVKTALKDAGLTDYVEITYENSSEYSDKYEAGQVMKQSVKKESPLNTLRYDATGKKKKITLTLSIGSQPETKTDSTNTGYSDNSKSNNSNNSGGESTDTGSTDADWDWNDDSGSDTGADTGTDSGSDDWDWGADD